MKNANHPRDTDEVYTESCPACKSIAMAAISAISTCNTQKKAAGSLSPPAASLVVTVPYFVESSIGGSLVVLSLTSTEIFD